MFTDVLTPGTGAVSSKKQYLSTWFKDPKYVDLNNDVPIYYNIKMRVVNNSSYPTTYKDVKLVSIKDDTTESVVSLYDQIQNEYIASFRVLMVVPHNINDINVFYTWDVGQYRGIIYRKSVKLVADGTVSTNSQVQVVSANTSTYEYDFTLGVGHRDYAFIQNNKRHLVSTGALDQYTVYDSNGGIWQADFYLQDYNPHLYDETEIYDPDYSKCILKGGVIYKYRYGATWYPNIVIATDYYGGFKYATLPNASSDLADIGVERHYVLGEIKTGHFITISWETECIYVWKVVFWNPNTLNNSFILVDTLDFSSYTDLVDNNVIYFYNDTIITDTGNRYYIVYKNGAFDLVQSTPLILSDVNPVTEGIYPGRDSDMRYGVMIFE